MTNQEKLYVYVVETSTYVDYEGQIEIKVNHFRKREKAEAFFDSISKGYEKSSETYETFSEGELLKSSFWENIV